MTKEEAQKELAELEPRERQEWQAMEAGRVEMDSLLKAWQDRNDKLAESWHPKFERVQKLKAFLEIVQ